MAKFSDIYHFKAWGQSKQQHFSSWKSYMFNSRRNAPFANFERQMITIQYEALPHPQRNCVKKRIWTFGSQTAVSETYLAYSLSHLLVPYQRCMAHFNSNLFHTRQFDAFVNFMNDWSFHHNTSLLRQVADGQHNYSASTIKRTFHDLSLSELRTISDSASGPSTWVHLLLFAT